MANRAAPAGETVSRARVEALSDGVFAIIVTLLVLELKVPHVEPAAIPELGAALVALGPKFVSWVISFATVCVIWLNHHRLLALTVRVDHGLFWLNANLLLWTSFVPFPTALLGDYPGSPVAVSLYGAAMALMAIGFVLMRWHLQRHADLLREDVDGRALRAGTRYSLVLGPAGYALGAALAWVSPWSAIACYAAIPLSFVFAPAFASRRSPA